jgi:hypothetical protein
MNMWASGASVANCILTVRPSFFSLSVKLLIVNNLHVVRQLISGRYNSENNPGYVEQGKAGHGHCP